MIFHFSLFAGFNYIWLRAGVTGVDLFFIISGYVIFMTLNKTKKPLDFIISRVSRLWPSYIVMMLLTLLTIYLLDGASFPSIKTITANLTMLQPWFFAEYIDDSYWTLTVELLFYVFMLILFISNNLKNIIIISSVIVVILILFYYFFSTYMLGSKLYIFPRSMLPVIAHFPLFFAGILFYKLKFDKKKWMYHILVGCCFLFSLYLFDKGGRSHFFINNFVYSLVLFIYFLIFYLFIYDKLRFLKINFLIFLGSISYCLYLIHDRAGLLIYKYFTLHLSVKSLPAVIMLIVIMVSVAALVTYKIERPVIKFIRSRYTSRQSSLV